MFSHNLDVELLHNFALIDNILDLPKKRGSSAKVIGRSPEGPFIFEEGIPKFKDPKIDKIDENTYHMEFPNKKTAKKNLKRFKKRKPGNTKYFYDFF